MHPAPSDDFEVGEVGLPDLFVACGFVVELVCRLYRQIELELQ
jgi:hypothetical protein